MPPANLLDVVEKLPDNIYVFSKTIESLEGIKWENLSSKNIKACMNFQLRFSPISLPVYEAIRQNLLGELVELEVFVMFIRHGNYGLFKNFRPS